jgi:hypothetical protein
MKRIFKYPLPIASDIQVVAMPAGAHVISAGFQLTDSFSDLNEVVLQVWAMVDPDAPVVDHRLATVLTGFPLSGALERAGFVATVQVGPLVFHVLDLGESK